MALADALVTALAAAFPTIIFGGATLPVSVVWTEDANVDLADEAIKTPLVWVLDGSDVATSQHSQAFEDYDLLIIVQMKIPAGADTGAFAGHVLPLGRYPELGQVPGRQRLAGDRG